jgi:hypothetical protein
MLRKFILAPVVATIALLPAVARAQFQQGDWEFSINGSGTSQRDFDSTSFSVSAQVGHFLSDQWSVGGRQSLSFLNVEDGGSDWNGVTRAFTNFHFDLDQWQPFIGASAGYRYGDDVREEWVGGVEGGVKWFANNTTFIFATVGYDVELRRSWSDTGFWVYGLGVGFRW